MPDQAGQWLFLAALVAMLIMLHWIRRVFWLFTLLVLPGTLAHETCHLLLGWVLNGRPEGFNLLPRRNERGWELGSASFSHVTWYNAFFIGLAPLALLPAAFGLMRWRLDLHPAFTWQTALAVYLIANLAYAGLPSWQDWKVAARSPIGWILLAGGILWGWHRYGGHREPAPSAPAKAGTIIAEIEAGLSSPDNRIPLRS